VGERGAWAGGSVCLTLFLCIKLISSSSVPHKSYVYGGQTGTTVCTVAFKKVATSGANGFGQAENSETEDVDPLYICIDVSRSNWNASQLTGSAAERKRM